MLLLLLHRIQKRATRILLENREEAYIYIYGYFRMVYEHPAVENRKARTGVSSFYGNWPLKSKIVLKSSQQITSN